MAGMAIASTAASVYAQQEQANAQAKAIGEQARNQAEEQAEVAEQELGERVRAGRRERARATVAAAESGVAGNSFAAQLMDSYMRQDMDAAVIQRQAFFANRTTEGQLKSQFAGLNNPTALGTGLQIAGSAVSGYQAGQQISANRKRLTISTGPTR